MSTEVTMEKLTALAKNRGFIYPGSEIYGGLANTWDYGCLLYTSPSPRDRQKSRMPSSA